MAIDQLHRIITIENRPQRIVSVVPSQTELLYDLGLENQVVGITKFCIHPPQWFKTKTRVGGTKNLAIERIKNLNPDLIIANKEENTKDQIEELAKFFPVWISDIHDIADSLQMIRTIGDITFTSAKASIIIERIEQQRYQLKKNINLLKPKKVAYFIWKDPWMLAGSDTFIHSMISEAGFCNIISSPRYPSLSDEEITELSCDYFFLSSEPYPFKQKHIEILQNLNQNAKTILVDGELFSWYGSRIMKSFEYFASLHEIL